MVRFPIRFLPLMCAAVVVLSGCYGYTTVSERQRPAMTIPNNIRKIAIVDRCRFYQYEPQRKGAARDVGRTYNYGVLECLGAAERTFTADSLFDSVCVPYGIELKGSGNRGLAAPPMSWEEVEKLCKKSKTDALVVLEKFNLVYDRSLPTTNAQVTFYNTANLARLRRYNRIDMSVPGEVEAHRDWSPSAPDTFPDGSSIPHNYPVIFYPASQPPQGTVTAETKWRIYVPSTRTIFGEIDQNNYLYCSLWRDPNDPYNWKPGPLELYYRAADSLGSRYAGSTEPSWQDHSRTYFATGNKTMRKAAKYAEKDNWLAAATLWRRLAENGKGKNTARACYNMAIAAEKQGSLAATIDWLNKAKTLGLEQAEQYLSDLNGVDAVSK